MLREEATVLIFCRPCKLVKASLLSIETEPAMEFRFAKFAMLVKDRLSSIKKEPFKSVGTVKPFKLINCGLLIMLMPLPIVSCSSPIRLVILALRWILRLPSKSTCPIPEKVFISASLILRFPTNTFRKFKLLKSSIVPVILIFPLRESQVA